MDERSGCIVFSVKTAELRPGCNVIKLNRSWSYFNNLFAELCSVNACVDISEATGKLDILEDTLNCKCRLNGEFELIVQDRKAKRDFQKCHDYRLARSSME